MTSIPRLVERARGHFYPFQGYESFFRKELPPHVSSHIVKIPNEHDLHSKIQSVRVVELEDFIDNSDVFHRTAILVEDKQKNKALIMANTHDFTPLNRKEVDGKEVSPHVVFGEASHIAGIQLLSSDQKLPFAAADTVAFIRSQKLTGDCVQSGINDTSISNPIQLSGAHIVGVGQHELINQTLPFLLGVNGPLHSIVAFPHKGQVHLMEQVHNEGGRTLLHELNNNDSYKLSLQEFKEIGKTITNKNHSIPHAIMAHIPNILHSFHIAKEDGESYERRLLLQFVTDEMNKIAVRANAIPA